MRDERLNILHTQASPYRLRTYIKMAFYVDILSEQVSLSILPETSRARQIKFC